MPPSAPFRGVGGVRVDEGEKDDEKGNVILQAISSKKSFFEEFMRENISMVHLPWSTHMRESSRLWMRRINERKPVSHTDT